MTTSIIALCPMCGASLSKLLAIREMIAKENSKDDPDNDLKFLQNINEVPKNKKFQKIFEDFGYDNTREHCISAMMSAILPNSVDYSGYIN